MMQQKGLCKALVIRDDRERFKDLGDVLAVARAEGKKVFKTDQNIRVIRIWHDVGVGWIAVISLPEGGCSTGQV